MQLAIYWSPAIRLRRPLSLVARAGRLTGRVISSKVCILRRREKGRAGTERGVFNRDKGIARARRRDAWSMAKR